MFKLTNRGYLKTNSVFIAITHQQCDNGTQVTNGL